jgi:hypothetical protein
LRGWEEFPSSLDHSWLRRGLTFDGCGRPRGLVQSAHRRNNVPGFLENRGERAFDPPGDAAVGNDWVLVLDDVAHGVRPLEKQP